MAYIALYRKWRPKGFEDVVGQSLITETLQKAIDTDKVAHAYLFSGPRGTGKTSTAKIFARAMNCVHGPTSHPCNQCEVCRHIISGESMDVVEIDAASNRSIEDIRTLRETIKFMPAEGHKKIYIIDEVHMLTTEAFNALLKTLEEPPSHVIFILATTEPERIPMTILSRCQRYEFRRITSGDIAKRLLYVAEQEHIDLTKGAAHILAVQADGGMRDALSMLDQCVSNAEGTIDEALIRNLLGLIGRDWLFSLSGAVFAGKGDVVIKDIDDIIRMGKEPLVILTEILEHLRAIMLYQAAPHSDTLAAYHDCMKELAAQAKKSTPQRVFAVLTVLQQALLSAKTSPSPRVAVEMGLLMASRATEGSATSGKTAVCTVPDTILERLTRLEQWAARESSTELVVQKSAETVSIPAEDEPSGNFSGESIPFPEEEAAFSVSSSTAGTVSAQEVSLPATAVQKKIKTSIPEPQTAMQRTPTDAAQAPSDSASVAVSQYQDIWDKMCQVLDKEKKKAVLSCIRNGRVVYIGEGEVIVSFKTAFMVKRANREDYFKCVDAALNTVLCGRYHMRSYQEGDAELSSYEKKNNNLTIDDPLPPQEILPSTVPVPEKTVVAAPEDSRKNLQESAILQPISLEEISSEERAVLEPLLKTVGDCNIYIEHKN